MESTVFLAGVLLAAGTALEPIPLPGGDGGIGFDDLRFSTGLHRVLVPAGRTGRLDLVDPGTRAVETIDGFSSSRAGAPGHSQGTTSADSGGGFLFAADRTRGTLSIIDPATKQDLAQAKLRGGPDYVRWVAPLHEIWVSEPDAKVIETFRLEGKPAPKLRHAGLIQVPDGPESLEIDPTRRRAYANSWHDATVAIDLDSREIVARWTNGCEGARGLALDVEHGFAFIGCKEGKAIALDVANDGKVLGRARAGLGVDVIAFSGALSHLYVPAGDSATLTVLGVGARGDMVVLGTFPTAPEAHCVTADDAGNAYVCDPGKGSLLVFRDPYPASR